MNKFELQMRSLFYKKSAKPHSDSTFTPLFFEKNWMQINISNNKSINNAKHMHNSSRAISSSVNIKYAQFNKPN